jgi:hypothetical protein
VVKQLTPQEEEHLAKLEQESPLLAAVNRLIAEKGGQMIPIRSDKC